MRNSPLMYNDQILSPITLKEIFGMISINNISIYHIDDRVSLYFHIHSSRVKLKNIKTNSIFSIIIIDHAN